MEVDLSMVSEDSAAESNHDAPASEQLEESPVAVSGSPPQPTEVVGPRTAPTCSVVNAVIDKKEDGPGPRCGHTLTAVAAVGEEGTSGYIGPRLILFGGATALEGNSAASGTPTSAGSAGISNVFSLFLTPLL